MSLRDPRATSLVLVQIQAIVASRLAINQEYALIPAANSAANCSCRRVAVPSERWSGRLNIVELGSPTARL